MHQQSTAPQLRSLTLRDRYVKVQPWKSDFTAAINYILVEIWGMYVHDKMELPESDDNQAARHASMPAVITKMFHDRTEYQKRNRMERGFILENDIVKMIAGCAQWPELNKIAVVLPEGTNTSQLTAIRRALDGDNGYQLELESNGKVNSMSEQRIRNVILPNLLDMLEYGVRFADACIVSESRTTLGLRNTALTVNGLLWAVVIASCSTSIALFTFTSILTSPVEVLNIFTPFTEDSIYNFIELLKTSASSEPIILALASWGLISTFIMVGTGLQYLSHVSKNLIEEHMDPAFAAYIRFEEAFCTLKEPLVKYLQQSASGIAAQQ